MRDPETTLYLASFASDEFSLVTTRNEQVSEQVLWNRWSLLGGKVFFPSASNLAALAELQPVGRRGG